MRLTYVFPVLILLFIVLFYIGCPRLAHADLRKNRRSAFCRRDALALGIIVILYAASAFYNLGDTKAPQSFHHFDNNESIVLDLGGETQVDGLMFYSGLNTGSYRLEYSPDGLNWTDVGEFKQSYTALFKWENPELYDGAEAVTRYIRLTAGGDMYLGELAVKSGGKLAEYACSAAELHDEQDIVPAYQTYLNSTYFDEIYHARTAFEHIEGVYPYEISHPPLGKLIIAAGIKLFGMTPFGWRFSGALFGVLMLPVLYIFLKRMFGGTAVPACGTAMFAFDFMHFTQTRIATIDTYAVFFILLMYLFMWLFVSTDSWRYLALSGLFFGLGAASKWTCLYAGAGLGVIWLIYWVRRLILHGRGQASPLQPEQNRTVGVEPALTQTELFLKNILFCLLFFVLIPGVIYYLSYYPYALAEGITSPFDRGYAQIVLENQKFMFTYHSGVTAEHPYASRWYQWILDIRPILYYLKYYPDGTRSSFGAWVNPVLCWAGLLALFVLVYMALARRDKKAGFLLIGYLAQLLPWVFISRITFEYHYFPSAVFLILALGYVFSLMGRQERWRVLGLTGLSVALFVLFYPALSGLRVDNSAASALLQWLPTWPF